MYKVTFLLHFRKDITAEAARAEWLGSHGKLALSMPGLRRYVQNHWVDAPTGHERTYDGSVDLWFDDEAGYNAGFAGPVGKAMLTDDLRLFDRSMTPAYVGGVIDEHVMLWEPDPEDGESLQRPATTMTTQPA